MSTRDGFEGALSDWLDDKAGRGAPDYVDEILVLTTRTRQRPAWSSLGGLLPMQTTLRFTPVPRLGWIVLIALATVAAVGIAVLAVGSRSPHIPPPFGPARNGQILYAGTDNDIHALDPVTGVTTAIVTGASGDHRPVLSPDGTKLLFLRDTDAVSRPMIMVANADGSDVRSLTGPLAGFTEAAWSHDGAKVAVVSAGASSKPGLQVFTVDGSRQPVLVNTHLRTGIAYLSFRPGDRELTFRGEGSDGDALITVAADGSDYWPFLNNTQGDGASLSPDGTKMAYQTWDGTLGTIHIVDVDTGADSIPALDPPSDASLVDGEPTWSPDGTKLLFVQYTAGVNNHLAVAPVAGGPRVQIGPAMPNCGCPVSAVFSPDGTKVLAHYGADGSTWLLDPTGATPGSQLSPTIAETASWQRTAN